MEPKKCKYCGEDIIGKRDDALFCSNTCKAKHWEQNKSDNEPKETEKPQEKKDVTSQLRGLLNGTANQNEIDGQGLVKVIVPLRKELRAPFEAEIRRLTDVRMQLVSGIEKLENEFKTIAKMNGNKWIWGTTGAGVAIGNVSSEDKTEGMIFGGFIGLIGGAALKKITKKIREKEKRKQAEKIVSEINSKNSELDRIEKQILVQKEKIRTIPVLSHKVLMVPASDEQLQSKGIVISKCPVNEPESSARLQTDVSDVCLTGTDSEKIINSYDLKKMNFKELDFRDRWFMFFGKPSFNFHCIIHGMPGEGKSTFAIQFAKYLAENIGKVVYISGEEGFSKTLRDKFINNDSLSKYLDIADLRTFDEIMKNIQPKIFNFIFIDSLDNMRIDAEKMKKIREYYRNSALITISQSTKDGKVRGSQELVHDCDISVIVENGIAKTNKNRFKENRMVFEVF